MAKVVRSADLPSVRSMRDGRRRIDIATEQLFGTREIKADRVIYEPGDTASAHEHPDADHVFLVLRGTGTLYADDEPSSLTPGDVAFIPRGEYHWFENVGDEIFEMVEIWVPAPTQTIWADPADP